MNKVVYLPDAFYPSREDWQRLGLLDRALKVVNIDIPDTIIYDVRVKVKNKSGHVLAKLPIGMSNFSSSTLMVNNSSILAPFKGELLRVELDSVVNAIVESNSAFIASNKNRAHGSLKIRTGLGAMTLELPMKQSEQLMDVVCLPFDFVASVGRVNVVNITY